MGRSRNPCTKNLIINSTLGAWQAWSGISLPCPADKPEARLRFLRIKNLKLTKQHLHRLSGGEVGNRTPLIDQISMISLHVLSSPYWVGSPKI